MKKIKFSLDCINYSYDITEKQPQLFVTPDFETLTKVLEQMAETLAFKRGGVEGLQKAKAAETVNTAELSTGLQISGMLKDFVEVNGEPAYLQFVGPTQLSCGMKQIEGHGRERHPHGFGTPVGEIEGGIDLSALENDQSVKLRFKTGVELTGKFKSSWSHNGVLFVVTFTDCTVKLGDRLLFNPEWGEYDMAVGTKVTSVFGGPADREGYGFADDFVAKVIPRRVYSKEELAKHRLYAEIRTMRETVGMTEPERMKRLDELITILDDRYPGEWLARLEILEIGAELTNKPSWYPRLLAGLKARTEFEDPDSPLRAGLKILGL